MKKVLIFTHDEINEKEEPVWKQTKLIGDWIRIFDCQKDTNIVKQAFDVVKNKIPDDNDIKLGSIVMTPNGPFRLLKVEDNIATIRHINTDKVLTTNKTDISLTFNIIVRLIGQVNSWFKITLNSNGGVEELKKKIEELRIINSDKLDYIIIHNGGILRDGLFFDQLNFKPNTRILLRTIDKKPHTIRRFTSCKKNSYYSGDNIIFNVNKRIKLAGVGLYGTSTGRAVMSHVKFMEGSLDSSSKVIIDEDYDIPPGESINNCITNFKFYSPISLNPLQDYTIALNLRPGDPDADDVYIGEGGQDMVEGDLGIVFTFKKGKNSGVTNVTRGAFPEFYYIQ